MYLIHSNQHVGEAVYVDDIPSPTNCLHGAFIYSTKPLVRVKGINFKTKPQPDGVSAVLSFKDIPNGGENVGSTTIFGTEPLFADDLTQCAGQRLAFVVCLYFLHNYLAILLFERMYTLYIYIYITGITY